METKREREITSGKWKQGLRLGLGTLPLSFSVDHIISASGKVQVQRAGLTKPFSVLVHYLNFLLLRHFLF